MGVISVMSEALANQIAAGEVVERPASCVKELIENSLDAKATQIRVSLVDGGIAEIVVQDNGAGMDESDVVLAFERHATSKLRHSRDLFSVNTLGFRGEALASIAAVAKVSLSSRQADANEGTKYEVLGTVKKTGPSHVGMPVGTRVEVRELFFNTPARLKYLKTVTTEQARCLETVQRIALARPDVAFAVDVSERVIFRTEGRGNARGVLASLYGPRDAAQFLPISGETSDYQVGGFVGRPTQSRSNRSHGYLFVNGRTIRNVGLHQAVVAAYGSRLMVNRHPMYAIYITMDPKLVDVNIHPHKAEVRFSEERDVANLVGRSVREALDGAFLVSEANGLPVLQNVPPKPIQSGSPASSPATQRPETYNKPLFRVGPASQELARPSRGSVDAALRFQAPSPTRQGEQRVSDVESGETVLEDGPAYDNTEQSHPVADGSTDSEPRIASIERPSSWKLRPVGQSLGMYVIADDGENLYIIDQHAAHEKILFERFHAAMSVREPGRLSLLTPVVVHLSASARTALDPFWPTLESYGLTVEPFGGTDLIVRTAPSIWEGLDIADLSLSLLTDLAEKSEADARGFLLDSLVMRACKAAIKANHTLSAAEMDALCDALPKLEDPFHCPHGRPIFIRFTNKDLEKGFKRIV